MKTINIKLTKRTIPSRYFAELLGGHTVPRYESNGEVMEFTVGKKYTIVNKETMAEVTAICTQNCPYALKLIK